MSLLPKSKLKPVKCPTCGDLANNAARPFCSSRCADVDLGRWFQGKYAIPAVDAADDTIIDALIAEVEANGARRESRLDHDDENDDKR
ncbi:DNA gyrase inhibitor YacG [Alphaproteobacteria bacterium]|nr:DNA gyrase inhibitor YacG [Alphaproteobacteria bacterium]